MAKGYHANQGRLEAIAVLGKAIGKRAQFCCEWCGQKEGLRVWDHKPDREPVMETFALLCARCRMLADGGHAGADELRSIRNALWSDVPAVAEGAAGVLSGCKEPWVREALEESLIDEEVKTGLILKWEKYVK